MADITGGNEHYVAGKLSVLVSAVHSGDAGLNELPCSKRCYFHDRVFKLTLGDLCIIGGLGAEPVAVGQAEEAAEAEIGIRCDGTPARNDFMNTLGRYIYFLSQTILADPHRFQKFFQEDFARGDSYSVSFCELFGLFAFE